jgi:hypothetical protein
MIPIAKDTVSLMTMKINIVRQPPMQMTWEVKVLQLQSPDGDSIEIKSNNEVGHAW